MQPQLIEQMKALRLRGMANALEESLTALAQKKLAPTTWLAQLLQAEVAERRARSYAYQLRLARFPMPGDLDTFDFRESAVNETQLRQLYTGEYLATARTIVFAGGTGTGKTHLLLPGLRPGRLHCGSAVERGDQKGRKTPGHYWTSDAGQPSPWRPAKLLHPGPLENPPPLN
jgi:hypothetical protein